MKRPNFRHVVKIQRFKSSTEHLAQRSRRTKRGSYEGFTPSQEVHRRLKKEQKRRFEGRNMPTRKLQEGSNLTPNESFVNGNEMTPREKKTA